MNLLFQRKILTAYSAGDIGWRAAMDELGLENFAQLQRMMEANGLTAYTPSQSSQDKAIDVLHEAFIQAVTPHSGHES